MIDAMKMSFQSPISQTAKSSKQKMDGATIKETDAFSKLLASLSAEGQPITEEQSVNEEQPTEMLEKLEKVLIALEQLPQEDLSLEQQAVLAAIIQMVTLQTEQLETGPALQKEAILESPLSKIALVDNQPVRKPINDENNQQETLIIDSHPPKAVLSSSSEENPASDIAQESTENDTAVQQKIGVLLQQIDQKLEGLSTEVPEEFDEVQKLLELDGEIIPADAKKLEQLFKQLADFIRQFEPEQSPAGKQTSFKQLEQVLKQLADLTQESESGMQGKEVSQNSVQSSDAERLIQPAAIAAPPEGTKATPPPNRPETAAPIPAVRISNLIEDLSDVFRGSLRITGSGDNAQIKVSIFPEHLGHLDIRLTTTDGKIAAQIFTSNVMAKEALELQVNQLRVLLTQQGMTVDRIEITQQSSQQSFGQQNAHSDQRFSQQQKQGTALHNKNGYQLIEEEAAAMERVGSSDGAMMKIDYTI